MNGYFMIMVFILFAAVMSENFQEVAHAIKHGIPVFYGVRSFLER